MSVKLQPRLAVLTVSAVFSLTGVSAKLPMLVVLSMNPGRCALEVDDFSAKPAVWVSIRSTSANAIVPEVAIFPEPLTLVSSVTAPVGVVEPVTIVGASLLPTRVTVTSCAVDPPLLSVMVTV